MISVEDEMLDFCHDCPDYDVCTVDPEEFEDHCFRNVAKGSGTHRVMKLSTHNSEEEPSLSEKIDLGMCTEEYENFQSRIYSGLKEARHTNKNLLEILDETTESVYAYFSKVFSHKFRDSEVNPE